MAWLEAPISDGAMAFLMPSTSRAAWTGGARANRTAGVRKAVATETRARTRMVAIRPAGALGSDAESRGAAGAKSRGGSALCGRKRVFCSAQSASLRALLTGAGEGVAGRAQRVGRCTTYGKAVFASTQSVGIG